MANTAVPVVVPGRAGNEADGIRRSTRDIKRRKFDDEYFESDFLKPGKRARSDRCQSTSEAQELHLSPPAQVDVKPTQLSPLHVQISHAPDKKILGSPSSTQLLRARKPPAKGRQLKETPTSSASKPSTVANLLLAAQKDVGRWQPSDDLALITAVMQSNDLKSVYSAVKFSCKFTFAEIERRWYSLLYDPTISKLAVDAMKSMPPELIVGIQSETLFSKAEEKILAELPSILDGAQQLPAFEKLLERHPNVFHFARTPKVLQAHWLLMREYRLLKDQRTQPLRLDYTPSFSEMEESIEERALFDADPLVERELGLFERQLKREARILENEIPKMQVLVESITGISPPDFDQKTLAVLRGRKVRYLVQSREVTLGRSTKNAPVDINLSLDGPSTKVSRRQATIRLKTTGEFQISNDGKRAIYVDGSALLCGCKSRLNNNSVIEISCFRFIFLVNQDLLNALKEEVAKM